MCLEDFSAGLGSGLDKKWLVMADGVQWISHNKLATENLIFSPWG